MKLQLLKLLIVIPSEVEESHNGKHVLLVILNEVKNLITKETVLPEILRCAQDDKGKRSG